MNRELLNELLNVALDVFGTGDYASVCFSAHGNYVSAHYNAGGLCKNGDFDYSRSCSIDDAKAIQEMIDFYSNLRALTPASN